MKTIQILKVNLLDLVIQINDLEKKVSPKLDSTKLIENYEIQIACLKKNLDNVMEENAYYKRVLDNQTKSIDKDNDYEKESEKK